MDDETRRELRSLYHPRYLELHAERIDRIAEQADSIRAAEPAAVELGAHRGAFLVGMAATWPGRNVVGIEWRERYVRLGLEKLRKNGVQTATLLREDARLAFPILFARESLEAVFVTFPDPWWKDRHASRRLLEPIFLRVLARRLAVGGRLYVKSDVFEYLHRLRLFADVSEALRPLPPERWPDERTWTLTTREKKCMRGAIPFGRGYYERRKDFDATVPEEPEQAKDFPIPEDVDPGAIIRGAPPTDVAEKAMQRARDRKRSEPDSALHDPERVDNGTIAEGEDE